jgi:tetratricopeptide (TPR) repeat protein
MPKRGPGQRLWFEFEDLLLLRATKDLLGARVPAGRIRRLLGSLRRQLPDDESMSNVTIYADGRRIVAWDGRAHWQPDSGQFLFNFDVQGLAERVPPPRRPAEGAVPIRSAVEWFDLGLELEPYSPEEARQAYRQALDLDPAMADAHVNLGRLDHVARDHDSAETHYRTAAQLDPSDPVPPFNLGVLFDDMNRRDEAIRAYRNALDLDPNFADAHYNLGLIYDSLGRRTETITHLRRARTLYGRPARG